MEENKTLLDQIGGVFTGDKQLGVEVRVSQKDLQTLAVYMFAAMFLGVLVANLVLRAR